MFPPLYRIILMCSLHTTLISSLLLSSNQIKSNHLFPVSERASSSYLIFSSLQYLLRRSTILCSPLYSQFSERILIHRHHLPTVFRASPPFAWCSSSRSAPLPLLLPYFLTAPPPSNRLTSAFAFLSAYLFLSVVKTTRCSVLRTRPLSHTVHLKLRCFATAARSAP
ncbi:hypothetical protein PRIPAC_93784 [Pristionchus pacificus]|nr:hypothetical protein PRIPAC_93784 [Pristionchus pacificus]